MTASPAPRARTILDIDRDIEAARRERGRNLVQIDQYLSSVAVLRSKHARAADKIDSLLEERYILTGQALSES